jgi:hypothetical protein
MEFNKIKAEEILKKYERDTDHWADQDYDKDGILNAMKEYAEWTCESRTTQTTEPAIAVEPVLGTDNSFCMMIQKKNPKKNAKQYTLVTVQDIFNILTEKNINKFMREFKMGMQLGINLRNLTKIIIEKKGKTPDDDCLKMPSFTWIDD